MTPWQLCWCPLVTGASGIVTARAPPCQTWRSYEGGQCESEGPPCGPHLQRLAHSHLVGQDPPLVAEPLLVEHPRQSARQARGTRRGIVVGKGRMACPDFLRSQLRRKRNIRIHVSNSILWELFLTLHAYRVMGATRPGFLHPAIRGPRRKVGP